MKIKTYRHSSKHPNVSASPSKLLNGRVDYELSKAKQQFEMRDGKICLKTTKENLINTEK
jgi:hypothetical protein